MADYSIYPSFAAAILSVVPIFSVGGVRSWQYMEVGELSDDPIAGSILRRGDLDKGINSVVVSEVFNAEWIFFGASSVAIKTRGILFDTTLNRAFRISGQPETDLAMCIAPLEACEVPTIDD